MLKIINKEIRSIHRALPPEEIAETSLTWKKDIHKYSPWKSTGDGNYLIANQKTEANITVAGECSSTFDLAEVLIEESGLKEWDSLIGVSQRSGCGRRKRRWISPPGNLYVSVVLPKISAEWQNLATVLTGFCLSSALEDMGCSTAVKWPNDIVREGKKVGGILLREKNGRTVVGVGLNLISRPADESLQRDGAFPPGRLWEVPEEAAGPISAWEFLVLRFKKLYDSLAVAGETERFINIVQPRLAFLNEKILVLEPGKESPTRAVFTGIDNTGRAQFVINGQQRTLREAKILPI